IVQPPEPKPILPPGIFNPAPPVAAASSLPLPEPAKPATTPSFFTASGSYSAATTPKAETPAVAPPVAPAARPDSLGGTVLQAGTTLGRPNAVASPSALHTSAAAGRVDAFASAAAPTAPSVVKPAEPKPLDPKPLDQKPLDQKAVDQKPFDRTVE